MARVQNTLIGKSSGSVGGATFSTWKGINVLKSKAVTVANPKTIPQQTQRNRMSILVSVFRMISGAVNVGFKTLASGKSEYNAFVSQNIINATAVGVAPAVSLVPADLIVSKGTMGITPITSSAGSNGNDTVDIDYSDTIIPLGGSLSDVAYGVVHNVTQDTWSYGSGALRSDGQLVITTPTNNLSTDVVRSYLFFKSASSDEVSDSLNASAAIT